MQMTAKLEEASRLRDGEAAPPCFSGLGRPELAAPEQLFEFFALLSLRPPFLEGRT